MTDPSALAALVDRLRGARVLCAGDVMLDRFIYGDVERISPEAPIPVVRIKREKDMLGGAGNVARNLAALGAAPIFISVVGDDMAGRDITALLADLPSVEPYILVEVGRQTTIKTRYFAGSQQLLRADWETDRTVLEQRRTEIMNTAGAQMAEATVLVLSDYGKGVLSPKVCAELIDTARAAGRPVVVDPKGNDYDRYRGATVVTPNRKELAEASRMPVDGDDAIAAAAQSLIRAHDLESLLVTRSQDGMTLVTRAGAVSHLPAEAREVFDVSGAGDTVVATVAAALGAGLEVEDAARLANVAAGIVVGKVGTAVVHPSDLVAALHHQDLLTGEAKVTPLEVAQEKVAQWRARGLKVGFTNGCFDLLHPGHVSLLHQARAAADRLVVGLNADASVRRLKGPRRPIQSEAARATVLASLSCVDLVVIFHEDTPMGLIRALKPDVLVKGADYTLDKVVGADEVRSYGGRVLLANLEPGFSTTDTIARMGPAAG